MNTILFNNEAAMAALKAQDIAVMRQVINGKEYIAVPDTPRIRAILNNTKAHFDWSEAIVFDHLLF